MTTTENNSSDNFFFGDEIGTAFLEASIGVYGEICDALGVRPGQYAYGLSQVFTWFQYMNDPGLNDEFKPVSKRTMLQLGGDSEFRQFVRKTPLPLWKELMSTLCQAAPEIYYESLDDYSTEEDPTNPILCACGETH